MSNIECSVCRGEVLESANLRIDIMGSMRPVCWPCANGIIWGALDKGETAPVLYLVRVEEGGYGDHYVVQTWNGGLRLRVYARNTRAVMVGGVPVDFHRFSFRSPNKRWWFYGVAESIWSDAITYRVRLHPPAEYVKEAKKYGDEDPCFWVEENKYV